MERVARGIPPYRRSRFRRTSPVWDDPDLGKIQDTQLAERHGVSREYIRHIRVALGIETPPVHVRHPSTPIPQSVLDAPLGEKTDAEIALELGVPRSLVFRARHDRGIPKAPREKTSPVWSDPDLGKVPDSVIAKQHATSSPFVCDVRNALGIAPFRPNKPTTTRQRKQIEKLAGTMMDKDLAARIGVSPIMVSYYRKKAGIPPFRKGKP